jgi:hypothetical protein
VNFMSVFRVSKAVLHRGSRGRRGKGEKDFF